MLEVNSEKENRGHINGDSEYVSDIDLISSSIGGCTVTVTSLGTYTGRLTITGTVNSFAVGGQELAIDNVRAELL